jgi:hypothetical protein
MEVMEEIGHRREGIEIQTSSSTIAINSPTRKCVAGLKTDENNE